MEKRFRGLLGILLFLAMIILFGLVVMFLWNRLMPDIFGLPLINYWQAFGLLALARILFGSMSNSHGHKNPFHNKWMGMNKKEREEFLQKHGHNFHDHHEEHETQTKPE